MSTIERFHCAYYYYYCIIRLEEIGASASKEYSLEKAMEKMKSEWAKEDFKFIDYRDTVSVACCHGD